MISDAAGSSKGGAFSEIIERLEIKEDKPLRVFILALSVLGILVSTNVAKAGPSMTDRDRLASVDPATPVQEATQELSLIHI